MQVYQGVPLLGKDKSEQWRRQNKAEDEIELWLVATEASPDPMEISEIGIVFQNCLNWVKRMKNFVP